jgi:hypothetical protein
MKKNLHLDHSAHYHRYRHSWIHFRCFARFGVAIVRCNYYRLRSAAATFAVDVVMAVAADDSESAVDEMWAVASKAFVDSD